MPGIRPIFLFSLPRSGSTLLQRMLAAHSAIATTSEPWLLLPLLESRGNAGDSERDGCDEYLQARDDFCAALPNGLDDYRVAVRRFAEHLYASASRPSSRYFLDKTPRYHRIAREIVETFPDGKFIFLWRQPLAVAASMMQTWSSGRWNLYRFEQDLGAGLRRLAALYRECATDAIALRYEDLLANPEVELGRILDYLELPREDGLLEGFVDVRLEGRFGDASGVAAYEAVSREPLHKWRSILGNPLRRRWARHYVESIDERDMATFGYSRETIMSDLDKTPASFRHLASDVVRMTAGRFWRVLAPLEKALRRVN